jgi:hypothetical protein
MEKIEYSLDSFGRVRKTILPNLDYTESQEELLKKEVKMEYIEDFGIREILIENRNLREKNLRLIDRASEVNEMRKKHIGLQAELGRLYADKENLINYLEGAIEYEKGGSLWSSKKRLKVYQEILAMVKKK